MVAIRPGPRGKKTTTRSGRVSNPPPEDLTLDVPIGLASVGKKRTRKTKKITSEFEEEEVEMEEYDEFYTKLSSVRVPPCTYDTSDFDEMHLFHIRMSNYLSWSVLEHHIHHFDQISKMSKADRRGKLQHRLQMYKMKSQIADIIMNRELGVWEAILCMNQAQRRLEYEKMRRFLRDNESIPIPADWNIMKFVASVDKRRRKQFGFDVQTAPRVPPTKKTTKPPAKKRKYTKRKAPRKSPSKKKKEESEEEEDEDELSEQEPEIEKGLYSFNL